MSEAESVKVALPKVFTVGVSAVMVWFALFMVKVPALYEIE